MKKETQHKTSVIDIEGLGEVNVVYREVATFSQPQKYLSHGEHVVYEDDLQIELIKVEREVLGNWIDCLPSLEKELQEKIIQKL